MAPGGYTEYMADYKQQAKKRRLLFERLLKKYRKVEWLEMFENVIPDHVHMRKHIPKCCDQTLVAPLRIEGGNDLWACSKCHRHYRLEKVEAK